MSGIKRIIQVQKRIICLIVLNTMSFSLLAQLNSGNLSQITEKDGLSSNSVNAMLVDKQGYLWVSTYNGLARYNGYEFEKFYSNPNDTNAIQGMIAYSLMQDSKGNIWVGTNPSYIEMYDPVKRAFSAFNFIGLINPYVRTYPQYGYTVSSICEDAKGNIYFGISGGEITGAGLLYKSTDSKEITVFETPDSLQIGNVYSMHKDPSGNIWVYNENGIFKIDTTGQLSSQSDKFDNPLLFSANDYMTNFVFTDDQHIWLLTRSGNLFQLNPLSGELKNMGSPYVSNAPVPAQYVNTLMKDKKGHIWIGTQSGVQQFIPETGTFKRFSTGAKKDLEEASITCFAEDSLGNLFIGTANNGLLLYEEKPVFTSYLGKSPEYASAIRGWVNIIYETEDGKVWIHSDAGFSVLDLRTGKIGPVFNSSDSIAVSWITSMWQNSSDEFYFCYGLGFVYSYSISTKTLKRITLPGFPDNIQIIKHLRDSKGNEWLATRAGLYRKAYDSDRYKKYDLPLLEVVSDGSNSITNLIESPKHGLWIITDVGLFLYHYDTDEIERLGYDTNKGDVFISQDINSLYEDSDGVVWVGQWQGGLARFVPETGEIKKYTLDDGLPSMGVQSLIGDNNGMIWLSTFNGLSRFDPATEQFNNYSIDDGIQGSLFADGSYLRTSSGLIIFGGANGFTVFNPDDFVVKYQAPKVFLTDLKLFTKSIIPGSDAILKKPVYETKQVVLNHNQNNLTIDFIALYYSNPLKSRYSYKLENYDDEWRNVINQREAFYPNLPPGNYIFRVKAANDKGVWNEEGATLQIHIKHPWYATLWAYIIYGLLLILLALAVNRYMRNRTIRKERERAQKKELEQAREIEKAYTELKATQAQLIQAEKMASLGELTAGIAHEIQNPLNFVNNFSEVSTELLDEMKDEIDAENYEEVKAITEDVIQNLEKILHHGKRADGIVKSMLQHSRGGGGEKILTDINVLADEYLRLSYHGLRAKDKSFNADFKLETDDTLPKINIIPQDIGRVLLNLINNAFYTVSEKARQNIAEYKPVVTVSTKWNIQKSRIEIRVKDNGNGIPEQVKKKIFQPFFTTKPTGQGTGLGLSLSYDIIKTHKGEIKVESIDGEGTEFTVELPKN